MYNKAPIKDFSKQSLQMQEQRTRHSCSRRLAKFKKSQRKSPERLQTYCWRELACRTYLMAGRTYLMAARVGFLSFEMCTLAHIFEHICTLNSWFYCSVDRFRLSVCFYMCWWFSVNWSPTKDLTWLTGRTDIYKTSVAIVKWWCEGCISERNLLRNV